MARNAIRICIVILFIFSNNLSAQFSQTVKGKLSDQILQKPLANATVVLITTNESVITKDDGSFRFNNVPVGNHQLIVSHIGYKDAVDNITVISGKETEINILLQASVATEKEVEVVGRSRKNRPLNDMSIVSARAFTVEETQKFAAAVNDPLRMATSFAGVVSADDGNNEIVIRGNSPSGLLWRMEGIDIPNPNHFSNAGSSGGGISILSAQLLSNSDFVTGAFSSEYGNALSGVFDLKLRKGNNEQREYTVQAGLLGLNIAAEGPISRNYKGSYLINYRYSTLQLLSKIGLDVAEGGVTNFQDLSLNVHLPTSRAGEFSLFAFAGLSDQENANEMDSAKWDGEEDRYGGTFKANTSAVGITHKLDIGDNSRLNTAASLSFTQNDYNEQFVNDANNIINTHKNIYSTTKITISSTLNHRFSNRSSLRTGIIENIIGYNYLLKSRENPSSPVLERINSSDKTFLMQAFAQWNYMVSDQLTLQGGMHAMYFFLNNSSSLEPRVSVKYELNKKNNLSFGYGLHSQVQALGVYFAKEPGSLTINNTNLSFTKAHHFILSYGHVFNKNLKFKSELYLQQLFNVPVSIYDSLTFSTLNIRGDYISEALTNEGKGRNYGIDLTVEKNLANNLYFIFNQSFYQSKYTAADGIERNTRFNGNHVSNFTGGKEYVLNNGRRTIGANIKLIYAGGFRTTPIDDILSVEKGYTVYREKEAFTKHNPDYFRTDIRLSMKWNRRNHTSTLSLDIQNVTNRQNIYSEYYDPLKKTIRYSYQTGIIPVLNYKVDF